MKKLLLKKVVFLLGLLCFFASTLSAQSNEFTLLVGTYTQGSSEGIYVYRLNTSTLQATLVDCAKMPNPSYLAVSADEKHVYAVSEGDESNSAVYGYQFNKKSGKLTALNQSSVGSGPCFIYLNEANQFVVTANYGGGSVSVLPIKKDGSLGVCTEKYTFAGKGADPARQDQSHMHCIAATPDRRSLFATDLGTDCMYSFNIIPKNQIKNACFLQENKESSVTLEPGSGPRHMVFNAVGTRAYVINELSGTVSVFRVSEQGEIKTFHEIQAILADTCYAKGSAGIQLSPDEKFLYVSTRLEGDGMILFRIQEDGTLVKANSQPTGKHPRHFTCTPDGKYLLVACRDSDMIQIFKIDRETGQLSDTGKQIQLDQPVFVHCMY